MEYLGKEQPSRRNSRCQDPQVTVYFPFSEEQGGQAGGNRVGRVPC